MAAVSAAEDSGADFPAAEAALAAASAAEIDPAAGAAPLLEVTGIQVVTVEAEAAEAGSADSYGGTCSADAGRP